MNKLILILTLFVSTTMLKAQSDKGFNRIYYRIGISTYSNAPSAFGFDDLAFENSLKRGPVLQAQFQRSYGSWFDLGFAVSNQSFLYENFNYKFNTSNGLDSAHYIYNLNRLNISIVTIFNYLNNDEIKIYSGFRNGVTFWLSRAKKDNKIENDYLSVNWNSNVKYAPQIILFGVDYNFVETIGVNMELAFGSPYYAICGIHYTF